MKNTAINELFPPFPGSHRLMTVWAHPDDESLNTGGILALASRAGVKTYVVCLTKGEMGLSENTADKNVRSKELRNATKILGVSQTIRASFPDSQIVNRQEELYEYLKGLFQKYKPHTVITHDPSGRSGHPDHIAISKQVYRLWKETPDAWKLYFSVLEPRLKKLYAKSHKFTLFGNMPPAQRFLSIEGVVEEKVAACLAHESQRAVLDAPLPLNISTRLFAHECLHEARLGGKYRFTFVDFVTRRYTYRANSQ